MTEKMCLETLDLTVRDGIAVAVFNRPDTLNTFGVKVMRDLIAVLDRSDADDAVRALIVTGSGKAFCAGADLNQGQNTFAFKAGAVSGDIEINGVRRDRGGRLALRLLDSVKPVVAAVNGVAIGIGATLQLAMDARLAASDARFGFPFARRGITPEACATWFLPRLVGVPTALDWLSSGRTFGANEAHARGLVQSVHEPETLLDAAFDYAHQMTDRSSPVSVALTRRMVWRMMAANHPLDAHQMESRAIQYRGRSEDAREGIRAFLEKRDARFPDRISDGLPDSFDWRRESLPDE